MADESFEAAGPGLPAPKKKGNGLRNCLACCCLFIILLGLAGGYAGYAMYAAVQQAVDPALAGPRLQALLPATIPTGYATQFCMHVPFYNMDFAIVAPDGALQGGRGPDSVPLFMIIVSPPPGTKLDTLDDAKKQMEAAGNVAGGQAPGGPVKVEAEDGAQQQVRTVKVRGEDCQVWDSTGRTNQGAPVRQAIVLIPKTKGSADKIIIAAMGTADAFDQQAFDAYLGSIR